MYIRLSRRGFLNSGVVGAAALWASRKVEAQPSDRVVVGVMGLSRGLAVASSFAKQEGVEVRYLCDTDSNRAANAVDAISKIGANTPQAVADFRRILDDPEVDVLVCAAPNHWHAPATILALNAGKHVYVEKPCSHNPREAELMVEAATKYGKAVQVGTQRRSSPSIRAAIERMKAGEIGRVYSSRAVYAANRGTIGIGKPEPVPAELDYELWQGPAPRRPYLDNRVPYNWHWFWHWGNGELGNNGVHTLDLCRWGLGVDFPVRVTSIGGRYCFDDDQETPDTHSVGFEFEGEKLITWQGHSCNPNGDDFVNFYGEKGTLKLAGGGDYAFYDMDNKETSSENGTLGEIEHVTDFLAAIRDNQVTRLHCGIHEAYPSTVLCHLGNIAQRVGRSLQCHGGDGHIQNDAEAMGLWSREYEPGWEPKV
ncbi:MAG: dehydrogenase [Candidatus Hydrogenedentota bacterium]